MKKNLQKEMIRWMLVLCGAVIMVTCEKGDDLQLTHQEDTLELQSNKFTKFMETRSFSLDRSQGLYTYMQGTGYMLSRSGNHNILVLPLGEVHLETGIGVVQDDTGGVNYAFHLNENEPLSDTFYNYVLKKDVEGNFINDYILEYRMSPSFAGQYNAGIVSLDQFEGAVQRLSTSSSRTMETLCPLNEVNNGNGNNSNGTGTASGDGNYGDDVPDDGNTGDPGDTAGDGNSQDSDPYGNGTGEGPGSSDTGTNTACTMTRMVRGCGC